MANQGLHVLLLQLAFSAIYPEEETKLFPSQNCNYSNTDRCSQVLEQAPKQRGGPQTVPLQHLATILHVTNPILIIQILKGDLVTQ